MHHVSWTVTLTLTGVEHGMRIGDGGGGETWWGTLAKPRAEPRSEARIVIAYIMIVDVMSTCAAATARV